jgi:hypothetical protein
VSIRPGLSEIVPELNLAKNMVFGWIVPKIITGGMLVAKTVYFVNKHKPVEIRMVETS